jgi:hypothetical protein
LDFSVFRGLGGILAGKNDGKFRVGNSPGKEAIFIVFIPAGKV